MLDADTGRLGALLSLRLASSGENDCRRSRPDAGSALGTAGCTVGGGVRCGGGSCGPICDSPGACDCGGCASGTGGDSTALFCETGDAGEDSNGGGEAPPCADSGWAIGDNPVDAGWPCCRETGGGGIALSVADPLPDRVLVVLSLLMPFLAPVVGDRIDRMRRRLQDTCHVASAPRHDARITNAGTARH